MARPRTFDETEALGRAMALFWSQGYEHTSMDDLVRATGVHRGSLYSLYTDKRGMLLAALARYADEVILPQTENLRNDPDGWRALERFLTGYTRRVGEGLFPRGCLAVQSALGAGQDDPEIAQHLQATARIVEDALEAALRRAQAQGDIPPGREPRDLAQLLRCMLYGLQAYTLTTPQHEGLATLPRTLLAMLKG